LVGDDDSVGSGPSDGSDSGADRGNTVWPTDGAVSGTRLALSYWQGPNGERLARRALFDRQIGEECIPAKWKDGVVRCTPQTFFMRPSRQGWFDARPARLAEPLRSTAYVVFADATCDQLPLALGVWQAGSSSSSRWAVDVRRSRCDDAAFRSDTENEVAHVYRTGPVRIDSGFYVRSSSSCDRRDLPSDMTLSELGAEVPADTFARMVLEVAPGADPLLASFYVSEDGAKLPAGPRSAAFQDDCYFRYVTGASTAVCIPRRIEWVTGSGASADPGCRDRVVRGPLECPAPSGSWESEGGDLARATFRLLGAPVSAVYCAESLLMNFWLRGAPVELPIVTRGPDAIVGRRLQGIHMQSGAFVGRDAATFYDAELKVECALTQFPGEDADAGPPTDDAPAMVYRPKTDPVFCEPRACGGLRELFTDAACSNPVSIYYHVASDDSQCTATPVPTYVGRRQVLGKLTGSYFEFYGDMSKCVPVTANAHDYKLGPELPVSTFVGLTAVHD